MVFDKEKTKNLLDRAFISNSEHELLKVLKNNTFLFSDIYSRQYGICPVFSEVPFGNKYRCDFCWLNDNSDGPEWVLVEVEKPDIKLFTKLGDPSAALNHVIEQVRSWSRYFKSNPSEKNRIFGAVSKFRYVLVVGSKAEWNSNDASIWKSHFNSENSIEIRSMDTFYKSLTRFNEDAENLSFEQFPVAKKSSELSKYCSDYEYIKNWKNRLTSNV